MEDYDLMYAAATPGPLGINDRADPDAIAFSGDSPGTVGLNDAAAEVADTTMLVLPAVASSSLTPLELEGIYHNLQVPYVDPETGATSSVAADIHIYANNGLANRQSNLPEKDRLVGLIRAELSRLRGSTSGAVAPEHRTMVAQAFFAKGSPADCVVACFHALRYSRTTTGGLQTWIDGTARIGLDCSGFVNNYFIAAGRLTESMTVAAYGGGARRDAAADVGDLDVLVWDDNSHIAVIDHVIADSDPRRMVVVESSGSKEGLVHSEYTILGVERGLFHVDRGGDAQGQQSRSHVRIVAPPGAG